MSVSDKTEKFARALPIVLREEGGKVDDPRDKGGRTNAGVTQRVYNDYRQRKGLPTRDVYMLESSERDEIYRQSYWNMIKGDDLPPGIDLVVFDGAVNSGPARAAKWLQKAVGVPVDGLIGPTTLHAAEAASARVAVIRDIMAARRSFLKGLKTFGTFGRGWMARCDRIEQQAVAMAGGSLVVSTPAPPITSSPKAPESDTKAPPPKGIADVATGVGVGAGGLSQVVNSAKDQLEPYSGASHWVSNLVIGLIVVGAILAIGGLAWRVYAMWKANKMKAAG